MRNHLAEVCLNSAMLSLMKSYAATLCERQRKCLTGTLKFLSITSDLISLANNDSPVVHLADSRFSTLEVTMSFFSDWETGVLSNTGLDHATTKLPHVPRDKGRCYVFLYEFARNYEEAYYIWQLSYAITCTH